MIVGKLKRHQGFSQLYVTRFVCLDVPAYLQNPALTDMVLPPNSGSVAQRNSQPIVIPLDNPVLLRNSRVRQARPLSGE